MPFLVRRKATKAVSRSIQAFKSAELGGTEQNGVIFTSFLLLLASHSCMHIMSLQEALTIRLLALVLTFETGVFICPVRGRVTK